MIFFIKRDFPLFNAVKKVIKTVICFLLPHCVVKYCRDLLLFHRKKRGTALAKKGYLRIFEHSLHEAESRHVFK